MRTYCPICQFAKSPTRHSLAPSVLALMLWGLCLPPVLAQGISVNAADTGNCTVDELLKFRGGTARLENDLFTVTDQNYTNGVAFTLVSHDIPGKLRAECLPVPIRLHARLIKFLNPEFWTDADNPAHTQNVVVKFGQSMYTPEDYSRTDLIEDDRPYAGLLIGLMRDCSMQGCHGTGAGLILNPVSKCSIHVRLPWV